MQSPHFSPSPSRPVQVVNGLQPGRQENGLSGKGDTARCDDIVHLNNRDNTTNGGRDGSESRANEAILTFDSEDSFMKKTSPIKPQHVAGKGFFLKKRLFFRKSKADFFFFWRHATCCR